MNYTLRTLCSNFSGGESLPAGSCRALCEAFFPGFHLNTLAQSHNRVKPWDFSLCCCGLYFHAVGGQSTMLVSLNHSSHFQSSALSQQGRHLLPQLGCFFSVRSLDTLFRERGFRASHNHVDTTHEGGQDTGAHSACVNICDPHTRIKTQQSPVQQVSHSSPREGDVYIYSL